MDALKQKEKELEQYLATRLESFLHWFPVDFVITHTV